MFVAVLSDYGGLFCFLKIDQLFFGIHVKEETGALFLSNSCLSSPTFPFS